MARIRSDIVIKLSNLEGGGGEREIMIEKESEINELPFLIE